MLDKLGSDSEILTLQLLGSISLGKIFFNLYSVSLNLCYEEVWDKNPGKLISFVRFISVTYYLSSSLLLLAPQYGTRKS